MFKPHRDNEGSMELRFPLRQQFAGDRELPLDAMIEIALNWPVTMENGCPAKLVARGLIVCSVGTALAYTLRGPDFRTQSRVHNARGVFARLNLAKNHLLVFRLCSDALKRTAVGRRKEIRRLEPGERSGAR